MTARPRGAKAGTAAPQRVAALPPGVSEAEWAREMGRWQNPRIRAILGCLRTVEPVLDSNYAILHCSPQRLQEMVATVRRVAAALRGDIRLLIQGGSRIPELEASRQAVEANLNHLAGGLLKELDSFEEDVPQDRQEDLRRFLCVAIGQIHRFLQDSFGGLMAADPRARRDADYYLSRQFPRDVEEAEWLLASVARLEAEIAAVDERREACLVEQLRSLRGDGRLPTPAQWAPTEGFLDDVVGGLGPRLREVIALRGIRLEELELLTHYSLELPTACRIASEVFQSGSSLLTGLPLGGASNEDSSAAIHRTLCDRLAPHLRAVDESLRDLAVFVPLWRRGVSQRRALLLRSPQQAAQE